MREVSFTVSASEQWGEGLVSVVPDEPIAVAVRLESVHEGILVTGEVDTRYRGECSRCLSDVSEACEVEFQELFAYPEKEASDWEVQDDHVDLENLVRDAIVISLPFQPVCQPDCPGLDPETGERLVPGQAPATPIDSRWAALADFTTTNPDPPQARSDKD